MNRLANKVAIVTGSGSGIGKATALLFSREGAKVVIAEYNEESGLASLRVMKDNGGEALFTRTDVSQPEDVKAMVNAAVERYGRLDTIVNCAGIALNEVSTTECNEEIFTRIINTNLKGVWLGMKYAIPEMIRGGSGTIVNFASIAALEGYNGLPAYSASKGGVISISRVAAIEFASKNIRVNCVAPGHISTPMFLNAWDEDGLQRFINMSPLRRLGEPEEVANVVLLLASDESSHITGQTIIVDGGITARVP